MLKSAVASGMRARREMAYFISAAIKRNKKEGRGRDGMSKSTLIRWDQGAKTMRL